MGSKDKCENKDNPTNVHLYEEVTVKRVVQYTDADGNTGSRRVWGVCTQCIYCKHESPTGLWKPLDQ